MFTWNLYANPHAGACTPEPLDQHSRTLLLYAALAETQRFLQAEFERGGPPCPESFDSYQNEVWTMCHGHVWVDVDIVAIEFCGYGGYGPQDSWQAATAFREPLLRVDVALQPGVSLCNAMPATGHVDEAGQRGVGHSSTLVVRPLSLRETVCWDESFIWFAIRMKLRS